MCQGRPRSRRGCGIWLALRSAVRPLQRCCALLHSLQAPLSNRSCSFVCIIAPARTHQTPHSFCPRSLVFVRAQRCACAFARACVSCFLRGPCPLVAQRTAVHSTARRRATNARSERTPLCTTRTDEPAPGSARCARAESAAQVVSCTCLTVVLLACCCVLVQSTTVRVRAARSSAALPLPLPQSQSQCRRRLASPRHVCHGSR